MAFVSVGAGPVTSPISYFFLRLAMLAADDVSFRDHASRDLAACSWAGRDARVTPDLAFSLLGEPIAAGPGGGRKLSIGLNPMPVYDRRYWHTANEEAYSRYIGQLAAFCTHLESSGHFWFFYSMQPKDANVMADVVELLRQQGRAPDQVERRIFKPETVDELVSRLAHADILVATRFHGVVLPLMVGRPALGVCYHRKISDVLENTGLSGFHVELDRLDAIELAELLRTMEVRRDELQKTVRAKARRFRHELDELYERLLDLVPHSRRRGAAEGAAQTEKAASAA